ncbi:13585_t:CDS:2 [Ambispora leptoticha]|uniref:13585_t:CDS:1 n=1 Tax=Ambispora leptoticha TaxID=144679 RepID=A0A9N8VL87_9GLOM|nr:13585_t:CDS:2 [Ambispora leptoticha]
MGSKSLDELWKTETGARVEVETLTGLPNDTSLEQLFQNMRENYSPSEFDTPDCQMHRWHLWRKASQTELAHFSKMKLFGKFLESKEFLHSFNPSKYDPVTEADLN